MLETIIKIFKPESKLDLYYKNLYLYSGDSLILQAKIKGLAEQKKVLRSKKKFCHGYFISKTSRYHLLAYGFLRKKPYKSIENKCSDDNKVNISLLIRTIKQCMCNTWATPEKLYCFSSLDESLLEEWLNAK